jgi:hypothetical protein
MALPIPEEAPVITTFMPGIQWSFVPDISAGGTLRFMHEQHPSALWAGPFLVLGFDETSDADLPDVDQVVNYA